MSEHEGAPEEHSRRSKDRGEYSYSYYSIYSVYIQVLFNTLYKAGLLPFPNEMIIPNIKFRVYIICLYMVEPLNEIR